MDKMNKQNEHRKREESNKENGQNKLRQGARIQKREMQNNQTYRKNNKK